MLIWRILTVQSKTDKIADGSLLKSARAQSPDGEETYSGKDINLAAKSSAWIAGIKVLLACASR